MKFDSVKLQFKANDLWIGIHWRIRDSALYPFTLNRWLEIYVCLIPTLSLRLRWRLRNPDLKHTLKK